MKINWQTQLAELIKARKHAPFVWGENDCCLFAADAIELMTGVDPAAKFRGKYTTKIGAAKALKRYGQGTIRDTISAIFGEPQDAPLFARGSVCIVEDADGQDAAAIWFGQHAWAPHQDGGLAAVTANNVKCNWRVDTWAA